ncbi:MAG: alpha/beta fold hydrolase [Deltaproteobacteria bacterium]|nr:MAG: alpha/beta fold hydrolase [Deltaproteobacteria bacterium]
MAEINPLAFSISRLGIRALESLFKTSVKVHDAENIPEGVIIFAVNHFTRLETLILPYEFYNLTGKPVMSLAYHGLFTGALGSYLESVGAVSTKDPNRDKIIIGSLLTGEHPWLIFPEGAMIKDKKIIERGKFLIYSATGARRPPHTGAAALALRTEFYRQRLYHLQHADQGLLEQQLEVFGLASLDEVTERETYLVPVNLSYYPIRSRQNAIEKLASYLVKDIPERLREELQTEGTMLMSGVDMDISFCKPLAIKPWLNQRRIQNDITTPRPMLPDDVLPSRSLMRRIASRLTMELMACIYRSTTVNHDHLAAYLLRYYPGRRQSVFDLAERLYLASEKVTRLESIRFHSALHQDQCVQLCREYQGKVTNFLAVAEQSGAVKVTNDTIEKRKPERSSLFDFHTIRRDNPYQVILNEVEFLRPLTRQLHAIARHPRWLIRWRLRRRFRRIAQEEFAADYIAYQREGESKPRRVGTPRLYRRMRAKAGVLLVHGYMAAPEEVRPLAEHLHRNGYAVFAPRLRGHGTSPEDLATRSWEDWLQSVERGHLILANSCDKVVLGGFSAGAGLALLAASSSLPEVSGVFAINCAMRLRRRTAKFAPAVMFWHKLVDKLVKDEAQGHFVPNEPENPEINYLRNPLSGVKELLELMDTVSGRLELVKVPTLVIQSSDDPVVHPEGSKDLYRKLGSHDKELVMIHSDRHGIFRGNGSERVFSRVLEFADRLL